MSAKSISIVTVSIFGSVFLGIFLSTIIFDGPSSNSEKSFENESLERMIPKTESNFEPIPSSSTSSEFEGTIISSSSTGVE